MEKSRRNSKKFILIALLIACFVFLGVGYAYLSQSLDFSGTGNIDSNFKVEFTNVTVDEEESTVDDVLTSGSTGNYITIADGSSGIKDTINFDLTLNKPGDKIVATVTVTNTGEITAEYVSLVADEGNTELPADITANFVANSGVTAGTELTTGATHTFTFTFEWASTSTSVPTTTTLNLSWTLNYTQAV